MKKLVQIVLCFSIILSISIVCHSCKTPETSEPNQSGCDCDDLQCWTEKTKKESLKALQCSVEAGALAVGLKKMKMSGITDSVNSLVEAFANDELSEEVANQIEDRVLSKQNLGSCSTASVGFIKGFYGLAKNISGLFVLKASNDALVIETLATNIVTLFSNVKSFLSMGVSGIKTGLTCFTSLPNDGYPDNLKKHVTSYKNRLNKMKTLLEYVAVIYVLLDCGIKLTSSSTTLIANTKCLASDLSALHDSYKQLNKAYDNTLNTGLNCNIEAQKSCSDEIARNYGMALHKMISNQSWPTYLYYGSRASQCYNYCYSYAGSKEKCHSSSISLGSNLINPQVCRSKCETQKGSCLALCRSFCCHQDGACVNQVKKIQESKSKK